MKEKTLRLLCLFVLLFLPAIARAGIPEDYAALTANLYGKNIPGTGTPGSVAMFGTSTFPVILSSDGANALCAAGRQSSGDACGVAFTHTGFANTAGDYGVLLENAVKWAAKKTTAANITIATNISEIRTFFAGKGYTTKTLSVTSPALTGVDVVLVNMHNNFSANAITEIGNHAAAGKGLIFFATPWWLAGNLQQFSDARTLMRPFGFTYSAGYSSASTTNISATAYSPYYSALNGVYDLIREKENKITLTTANKKLAADAAGQVLAADPGITELNAAMETLGDSTHYGWINVTPAQPLRPTSQPVEAMLARYQSNKFDSLAPAQLFAHPSAAGFPGLPANTGAPVTRTISVNGNTPPGTLMTQGYKPTRIETGLYAAPGATIAITIPANKTAGGLKVHIGGTEDNAFGLGTWYNFPKIWRRVDLNSPTTQTGHVFGGLVTLLVPTGSNLGTFDVTVTGALPAPAFILGETTDELWNAGVKNNPGAYGYIQTDKLTIYIPRNQLAALQNPTEVATYWKKVMDTSDDIYGYTKWRKRGEVLSVNRQVSAGGAYAGYPIELGWGFSSETELNNSRINGSWGDYHELGHGYQYCFDSAYRMPTHAEVDVNINAGLLYALVHDRTCWDGPTHNTYDGAGRLTDRQNFLALPATEQTWANACGRTMSYDFYFNLSEAFGWEAYKKLFTDLMNFLQNPTNATDPELYAIRNNGDNLIRDRFYLLMCRATGRNLDRYFQRYGLGVTGKGFEISASVKTLVANKNYPEWLDNSAIDSLSKPAGALTIPENVEIGTELYKFVAKRAATPGVIWDFSITAGNGDKAFSIDKRTGALRAGNIDRRTAATRTLTVTVQDNGVPRYARSESFSVNIIADAGAPPEVLSRVFSANATQPAGTVLGTVEAHAGIEKNIASFKIIAGDPDDIFTVDSAGKLSLARPAALRAGTVIRLTVQATDNLGNTADAPVYVIAGNAAGLREERWNGTEISGTPNYTGTLPQFTTPKNVANNYIRRVSGFLIPPQTGNYTFWFASDDEGTLFLSANETPAGATAIASVAGYTAYQDFDLKPSQKSASMRLQGGQIYYIEARQREGTGDDHLAAAWEGPGFSRQIIPGTALIPNLTGTAFLAAPDIYTYDAWKKQYRWNTAGSAHPGADPAGTGITNLIKYAFGLDASASALAGDLALLPAITRDETRTPVFQFLANTALKDIDYRVETSRDLKNWTTLPATEITASPTTKPDEERRVVAINPDESSRFFRVKIIQKTTP